MADACLHKLFLYGLCMSSVILVDVLAQTIAQNVIELPLSLTLLAHYAIWPKDLKTSHPYRLFEPPIPDVDCCNNLHTSAKVCPYWSEEVWGAVSVPVHPKCFQWV